MTGEEEHRVKSNVTNEENSAPTFLIQSVLGFIFQFEKTLITKDYFVGRLQKFTPKFISSSIFPEKNYLFSGIAQKMVLNSSFDQVKDFDQILLVIGVCVAVNLKN